MTHAKVTKIFFYPSFYQRKKPDLYVLSGISSIIVNSYYLSQVLLFHHFLQGLRQLVRTACVFKPAGHAFQLLHNFICRHPFYELTYSLQVSVASAVKRHVVYRIVVVQLYMNGAAACTLCCIIKCLHNVCI